MPVFPSSPWIDAFCEQLARQPGAVRAADAIGGVYRFVIDPAGPLIEQHVYAVSLTARGGTAEVARVDPELPPRVGVRTDYVRWQRLLLGQLDLGRAMLFGRVRISGDLGALLKAQSDLDVLVDALRAVDTIWLEARA